LGNGLVGRWEDGTANIWLILMVIIWLMMVNNHLVGGGQPTPLKNDGVSNSWDDDIPKYMEK